MVFINLGKWFRAVTVAITSHWGCTVWKTCRGINVVYVNFWVISEDFVHGLVAFIGPFKLFKIAYLFCFLILLIWYNCVAPCIFQKAFVVIVIISLWVTYLNMWIYLESKEIIRGASIFRCCTIIFWRSLIVLEIKL